MSEASSSPADMKMAELLARISQECRGLADTADKLHGFARVVAKTNSDVEIITSLQALDRMTQYLTAFADIFGDCARSSDDDWRLDMQPTLGALTLSDLARRLAGNAEEDCEAAELDLF